MKQNQGNSKLGKLQIQKQEKVPFRRFRTFKTKQSNQLDQSKIGESAKSINQSFSPSRNGVNILIPNAKRKFINPTPPDAAKSPVITPTSISRKKNLVSFAPAEIIQQPTQDSFVSFKKNLSLRSIERPTGILSKRSQELSPVQSAKKHFQRISTPRNVVVSKVLSNQSLTPPPITRSPRNGSNERLKNIRYGLDEKFEPQRLETRSGTRQASPLNFHFDSQFKEKFFRNGSTPKIGSSMLRHDSSGSRNVAQLRLRPLNFAWDKNSPRTQPPKNEMINELDVKLGQMKEQAKIRREKVTASSTPKVTANSTPKITPDIAPKTNLIELYQQYTDKLSPREAMTLQMFLEWSLDHDILSPRFSRSTLTKLFHRHTAFSPTMSPSQFIYAVHELAELCYDSNYDVIHSKQYSKLPASKKHELFQNSLAKNSSGALAMDKKSLKNLRKLKIKRIEPISLKHLSTDHSQARTEVTPKLAKSPRKVKSPLLLNLVSLHDMKIDEIDDDSVLKGLIFTEDPKSNSDF